MPHIHEKIDFTVTILIVYEDRVLLVNHPRYNKWIPIGGHIELDEDSDEALFREIKEESGLDVEILSHRHSTTDANTKPLYVPNYMEIHEANPPHKHLSLTYFAQATNDKHVRSEEHTDMKWFGIEELDDPQYNLAYSIKFYAQEAIKLAKTSRKSRENS